MPQMSSPSFPTPDYERTLVLAIELSNVSWVLAAQIPGLLRVKAKRSIEPERAPSWTRTSLCRTKIWRNLP